MDLGVLGFAAILSLGAGSSSALPRRCSCHGRTDLGAAGGGGRERHSQPRALAARRGLVVMQFALSVVLVVGAGLLTRSLIAVNRVDLGYRTADS